jgi:hypothetical protein
VFSILQHRDAELWLRKARMTQLGRFASRLRPLTGKLIALHAVTNPPFACSGSMQLGRCPDMWLRVTGRIRSWLRRRDLQRRERAGIEMVKLAGRQAWRIHQEQKERDRGAIRARSGED